MIFRLTLAVVSVLLIETVREMATVIQMGHCALVDQSEAAPSRFPGLIRGDVLRPRGAAAGVAVVKVLTRGHWVTIVERRVETLVDLFDTHPSRIGEHLIHVAIPTLAGVLLRAVDLLADGSSVAIVLGIVGTDTLEAFATWKWGLLRLF